MGFVNQDNVNKLLGNFNKAWGEESKSFVEPEYWSKARASNFDWAKIDRDKQKTLESVLMGASKGASPYLSSDYKAGSISAKYPDTVIKQNLGTWEGLKPALGRAGKDVGKAVAASPIGLANMISYPIIEAQAQEDYKKGRIGYKAYKDTVDQAAEKAGIGLNDSDATLLRKSAGASFGTAFDILGASKLPGSLKAGQTGLKAFAKDVAGQAVLGGASGAAQTAQQKDPTARDYATNTALGAALGGAIPAGSAGLRGISNILEGNIAKKTLTGLVDNYAFGTSERGLREILGTITDANASKQAKKELVNQIGGLENTLALPAPSGKLAGQGFTVTDAASPGITAAVKQLKTVDNKLANIESGKISTTVTEYNTLKQQRNTLVKQIQDGTVAEPTSARVKTPTSTSPVLTNQPTKTIGTASTPQGLAADVGNPTPFGEGKTRKSTLGQSTQQKAVDAKLTETLGDSPEYKQMNMADQAKAATDILNGDEERAVRIALGKEEPPVGVIPESVYTAVENKALQDGNVQLLNDLAHSSRVTEATAMGQRIRALGERDPDSAVAAIREIAEARKPKGKAEVAKVAEITDNIKKTVPKTTAKDWSEFVESIKC